MHYPDDFTSPEAKGLKTSLVAVTFKGGVVIGADSRTSSGSYVANRVTDKLTHITDWIYCCRSGSAADTQAVADVVSYQMAMHKALHNGREPSVHAVANTFNKVVYSNKSQLMAGILVAGWDAEQQTGSVYSIPLGGGMFKKPWAIAGSGSTFVYGWVDAMWKDDMSEQEAVDFVQKTLALCIGRDGSSGGVIRMCVITKDGGRRLFVPGDELPKFWQGIDNFALPPLIVQKQAAPEAIPEDVVMAS